MIQTSIQTLMKLSPEDCRQATPLCRHLLELPTGLPTRKDNFYTFLLETAFCKENQI